MVNANDPNACFLNVFFDPGHHDLVELRKLFHDRQPASELVTVSGKGHLSYYSSHTGKKLEFDFPVLAAVMLRRTEECSKKALDRGRRI
jgi:hypothetical protein